MIILSINNSALLETKKERKHFEKNSKKILRYFSEAFEKYLSEKGRYFLAKNGYDTEEKIDDIRVDVFYMIPSLLRERYKYLPGAVRLFVENGATVDVAQKINAIISAIIPDEDDYDSNLDGRSIDDILNDIQRCDDDEDDDDEDEDADDENDEEFGKDDNMTELNSHFINKVYILGRREGFNLYVTQDKDDFYNFCECIGINVIDAFATKLLENSDYKICVFAKGIGYDNKGKTYCMVPYSDYGKVKFLILYASQDKFYYHHAFYETDIAHNNISSMDYDHKIFNVLYKEYVKFMCPSDEKIVNRAAFVDKIDSVVDEIEDVPDSNGIRIFKMNDKYGLVDNEGDVITKKLYRTSICRLKNEEGGKRLDTRFYFCNDYVNYSGTCDIIDSSGYVVANDVNFYPFNFVDGLLYNTFKYGRYTHAYGDYEVQEYHIPIDVEKGRLPYLSVRKITLILKLFAIQSYHDGRWRIGRYSKKKHDFDIINDKILLDDAPTEIGINWTTPCLLCGKRNGKYGIMKYQENSIDVIIPFIMDHVTIDHDVDKTHITIIMGNMADPSYEDVITLSDADTLDNKVSLLKNIRTNIVRNK